MIPLESLNMTPLEYVLLDGRGGPSDEEKLALLLALPAQAPEEFRKVMAGLLGAHRQARAAVELANTNIKRAHQTIDKLAAPPFFPVVFLRAVEAAGRRRAEVKLGSARRVVEVAPEVALDRLAKGHEVYLSHEANVVLAVARHAFPHTGEVAAFVRRLDADLIVVRSRDEELVLDAAAPVMAGNLQPGDAVSFSRELLMAFEKVLVGAAESLLLTDVPDLSPASIGGQDENLAALLSALRAALLDPEAARRFGVTGRNTIVMIGPPGCGKTSLARVAASQVARLAGRKARFAVVKPGELESPWVGETQRNIREFFKVVNREARDAHITVLFDELESFGRIRNTGIGHHDDKALTALLTEINGFKDRENVAIIAATNRPDLVDPALLDRCSDLRLTVRRPDLAGARAIFRIHLPGGLPYSPNGALAADTHDEVIETAVSLLYAPNADNEICRVRFRDGRERTVAAREMVSGRLIEQISKQARLRAYLRYLDSRSLDGITVADIQEAVGQGIERLRTTLSPVNARAYLEGLPQDLDVIAVEPIRRKVAAPHRYYNPTNGNA